MAKEKNGTDWEPTESDCQWVSQLLSSIKVGGQWFTSFAVFTKTGEHSLTLVIKIYTPAMDIDKNIARVKKSVERIGWTYEEDNDVAILGLTEDYLSNLKDGKDIIGYTEKGRKTYSLTKCPTCGFWHTYTECPYCEMNR